jgi:hypothetical protein
MIRRKLVPIFCGVAVLVVPPCANADTPAVTPYRPSVSTPAALSATGWVEAELGVMNTRGDDSSRQQSVPYTFKLAFSPDWGVRIGGNAFVRDTALASGHSSGIGDTSIVLKRRFALNDSAALGAEVGVIFPTARTGLGSDGVDYTFNGIYSADAGAFHTDLNLTFTRLGSIDAGQGRVQTGWAAAVSRQFGAQWSAVGELSGSRQSGTSHTAQWLLAGGYSPAASRTFDFGVSHGLNNASSGWSVFGGVTFLVGRVF